MNAAGVPCGPVYSMDEVFADPQVKHLGVAAPVKHPRMGDMRILGPAVGLSRTPASIVRATPELGEHTRMRCLVNWATHARRSRPCIGRAQSEAGARGPLCLRRGARVNQGAALQFIAVSAVSGAVSELPR